tara:strand:+ start:4813 stop:6258 length:1446 start_codon:yes stop_codon:yes gene_type:complete
MNLDNIIINNKADLRAALESLTRSGLGIVFIVDSSTKLLGILTDGDIRKHLLIDNDLSISVEKIMNTKFFSLKIETSVAEILSSFSYTLKVIPLLDEDGIIIDYATRDRVKSIPIASPYLEGNELKYITDCIKSNWISSSGKYIDKFESLFKKYHNGRESITVSNGTNALHLALLSLGIKKGDEVIVPNLTFAATINSIIYTGATPVLADIKEDSLNINIESIIDKITSKTRAILIVHLYGNPCEMNEIVKISKKHKLLLIEDCAEAIGSEYGGQKVGTFGDVATFSFFGNKTITTGEGGMVVFKSLKTSIFARELRDHGMSKNKKYWHNHIGYNYRMTNLQAAIGVAQFEKLDKFVTRKREIANKYSEFLSKYKFFRLPKEEYGTKHSYWLYNLSLLKGSPFDKNDIINYLMKSAIETRPIFFPLGDMPPYKKYCGKDNLSASKRISKNSFSLSTSYNLTDKDVNYILNKISEFTKLKSS